MANVSVPADLTIATVGPMVGEVAYPAPANPVHPPALVAPPAGNSIGGGPTTGQLFPVGNR